MAELPHPSINSRTCGKYLEIVPLSGSEVIREQVERLDIFNLWNSLEFRKKGGKTPKLNPKQKYTEA